MICADIVWTEAIDLTCATTAVLVFLEFVTSLPPVAQHDAVTSLSSSGRAKGDDVVTARIYRSETLLSNTRFYLRTARQHSQDSWRIRSRGGDVNRPTRCHFAHFPSGHLERGEKS